MKRHLVLWAMVSLLMVSPLINCAPRVPVQSTSEGCQKFYHAYLPIVTTTATDAATVRSDMIISRFGSAWATAYPFPVLKGVDDWGTDRPPIIQQVGGMSGGFDFYGDKASPLSPLAVKKSFNLTSEVFYTPGTGTIHTQAYFPELVTKIVGTGTSFTTDFEVGQKIRFTYSGVTYVCTVSVIDDDDELQVVEQASLPVFSGPETAFEIGSVNRYQNIESELDVLKAATIAAGESKLWGLLRDGTYRWAWAKCTSLRPPERYTEKLALPVELEFMLREGLWYGATQHTHTVNTQDSGYDFTLNNAGNHPAMVRVLIDNGDVTVMTSFKLKNHTNGLEWTYDNVPLLHDIIVDAGAYSVTDNGADAYSHLTVGAGQVVWMQLEPGNNSLEITYTGSPDLYTMFVYWDDTYL
ncbi:hypothetical protein PLCT2_00653 [Planctomycetaceae bacterium]|nr:hypothetical protein PLCT2_00653 [Planctomycetaceae bacterium]